MYLLYWGTYFYKDLSIYIYIIIINYYIRLRMISFSFDYYNALVEKESAVRNLSTKPEYVQTSETHLPLKDYESFCGFLTYLYFPTGY